MLTQDQIEAHFSGWLPTSVNINALPEGVRDYIHRLEANTDPQGEVKRAMIAEMQLAAVNKMLEERQWQPIETAPRDGRAILIFEPKVGFPVHARWDFGTAVWLVYVPWPVSSCADGDSGSATHWMPLPEPPA